MMVIVRHLTKEQELVHFDMIRERDEIQGADAITQTPQKLRRRLGIQSIVVVKLPGNINQH
jgi:hypothetical protein